jgi:hypothetical protein
MKDHFIPLMSWDAGCEYIRGFNEDEIQLLDNGIRKAVADGDWTDFLGHRMYYIS